MSAKSRYSTHVVELVRNNGISVNDRKPNNTTVFLMFDYFDVLIYKELEGEEKNYLNYFSIGDTFEIDKDYKVSYKTLGLYRSSDDGENPFRIKKDCGLTDIPFLGLIQISLCKENFVLNEKKEIDVECFLKECEDEIWRITRMQDLGLHTVMQLYRSSTTGDFCLAVRTDSVEKIYDIALCLSDSQSNPEKKIKMLTYTSVGLESCILPDGSYGTLTEEFIGQHEDMVFSLRLSADSRLKTILKKYEGQGRLIEVTTVRGLFGRYDYLMNIGMKEFAEIYPVLCEKKIGTSNREKEEYNEQAVDLKNILRYPFLRNVNERILVKVDISTESTAENINEDNEYLNHVINKNRELFEKIEKIEDWRAYFPSEYRAFQDLFRGMKEIYKTFSAVGMEKEAYINWLMFCHDMEALCQSINFCMQEYINESSKLSETEKRRNRLALLKGWRVNIQAINQYTRLVQNVNYQTYQSPVYEIQTQIDTEKMMVAYREVMRSYIGSCLESGLGGSAGERVIVPVIYPDLSKDKVEVTAPFINQRKREIICTVPSFEYFGRLYDLLPWIVHESSHHLRTLNRDERNFFVARYVLDYVFNAVMGDMMLKLSDHKLYGATGKIEKYLTDSMIEVAYDELSGKPGFAECDFEGMLNEIDNYLERIFPFGADFEGRQYQYKLQEAKKDLYNFFYDRFQKEELMTDKTMELILELWEWPTHLKCQKLAQILLEKYYDYVAPEDASADEEKILLTDILSEKLYFEKKLLEVRKYLLEKSVEEYAVKEYCIRAIEVHRVLNLYKAVENRNDNAEEHLSNYLDKVYEHYQKQYKEGLQYEESIWLADPDLMYTLRNLGLLNFDKELFCRKMLNIFLETDGMKIKKHREVATKIYLESFADLLMTTSLEINSFGYCRQVLQTVSDARIDEQEYLPNDINNERFKIVAAVLMAREMEEEGTADSMVQELGVIRMKADRLLEKGMEYCEYTLKCIRQKMLGAVRERNDARLEKQVAYFLGSINAQIKLYFQKMGEEDAYRKTLLYIVLHGIQNADERTKSLWQKYEELEEFCIPVKYIFRRLECFCLGVGNILDGGYLIVSEHIFSHMMEIRKQIENKGEPGCKWEKDWKCLSDPKMDVGEFYNVPSLVYEKTTEQKLENTIDFIQNYYYYNRFKMMEKEM